MGVHLIQHYLFLSLVQQLDCYVVEYMRYRQDYVDLLEGSDNPKVEPSISPSPSRDRVVKLRSRTKLANRTRRDSASDSESSEDESIIKDIKDEEGSDDDWDQEDNQDD